MPTRRSTSRATTRRPGGPVCCHSYVKAGRWEFLGDCTHDLAGQTVPMVPLPDWLVREGLEDAAGH